MFPAYKPSEIVELPAKYYLVMREYYYRVRKTEIESQPGYVPDLEVPGFTVEDWDKRMAEGKAI